MSSKIYVANIVFFPLAPILKAVWCPASFELRYDSRPMDLPAPIFLALAILCGAG